MHRLVLTVPGSLLAQARRLAGQEHASLNRFIVAAIADKVSALATPRVLAERGQSADWQRYAEALAAVPDQPPRPDDTLSPAVPD